MIRPTLIGLVALIFGTGCASSVPAKREAPCGSTGAFDALRTLGDKWAAGPKPYPNLKTCVDRLEQNLGSFSRQQFSLSQHEVTYVEQDFACLHSALETAPETASKDGLRFADEAEKLFRRCLKAR